MDAQPVNLTEAFAAKYPVANMIYHNKTLILLARKHSSSNSQQMALLVGMSFLGGLLVGFLVRCIYHNIVKYFMNNMDQIESHRPSQDNANPSFVDDSFRHVNDEPPDYVTVIADSSTQAHSVPQDGIIKPCKEIRDSKILEESPPNYNHVVETLVRETRSASA